ncbi:uncharacterized protein LOC108596000 [Drosophila busckii]|uniref:uncharacterized protein LOC108596000 n=1 Tax=Drosophila busckii TaxID=30019 RepID=UPI00083EA7C4|nr:uncharacterized protein LOC108596000 [Drosophila busckii]
MIAAFVITIATAYALFMVISVVVLYRRRQKAKANVGYVISRNPAPPLANQPNQQYVYQVHTYNGQQQPNSWQTPVHAAPVANAEPSVLPDTVKQQTTEQTHAGAVETISQV